MGLKALIHDLWLAGTVMQVLLVGVLLIRRTWSRFPIFTAYACCNVLESYLAYLTMHKPIVYFFVYWGCEAVTTVLGLAIVYEVFNELFSPHEALRKIARMVFRCAVVVLLVLGICVVAFEASPQTPGIYRIGPVIMIVAEAARFVEVGLLVFLFLFSSAFGLHWRAPVFGIALGLGVFVAVDLVNITMRSHMGSFAYGVLNAARGAAFCISVSTWATYLFVPEQVVSSNEVPKTAQLEQWNQAVMELISQ